MTKPDFAEGIYAKKYKTQYGDLIHIEIEIDTIRRNLTRKNSLGRECVYAILKTSKEGNLYAVIDYNKYPQLKF